MKNLRSMLAGFFGGMQMVLPVCLIVLMFGIAPVVHAVPMSWGDNRYG